MPEIAGARQPATATTPLVDPMQDGILDPGDGARCFGDRRHQEVGVAVTEGVRDLILLLQQQLVVGATGGAVQFDAGRQQHTVGPVERVPLRVLEQARVGEVDPLEAVQIAQAALRKLEVRFEQEGELTRLLVALADTHVELVEHPIGVLAPLIERLSLQLVDEHLTPTEGSDLQQRRRRIEITRGKVERLVDRPDGMPELHPGVPDRIPDALGDLGRRPFELVDQEQIEIRTRAQVATAVATHRRQREARNIADIIDDRTEPGIDFCGVRGRQRRPDQRTVGHDAGGSGNRLHRTSGARRIMS